ncbi:hypothetical protein NIES73_05070 [Sphaerospermopsis kisseleviana NIES-73]|nr:hypothetical protein NIES73_05070 [Sphaerospermopsis kisseleviana NIES-73]
MHNDFPHSIDITRPHPATRLRWYICVSEARWWDEEGNLLLTGEERAEVEKQKRKQLVEKLRFLSPKQLNALGICLEMLE